MKYYVGDNNYYIIKENSSEFRVGSERRFTAFLRLQLEYHV